MAVALFLLVFLVIAGIAAVTGHVVDSRDPEFSLGRVVAPRAPSDRGGR